ncbi:ArnT family glycosyltransferase [Leeuwenhoekiella sp. A16]|uniref:ArnT family glycosyltransferase n=1 Tax=unclassified Leeuwenhoekiella TaxID=2615029 RepID=UPI003A81154A
MGYNNRYNAGGDALDYISLGTVLAKTGYYGKAEDSDDHILNDFQNGNVENKSYKFKKHSTWRPPLWPGLIAFVFLIFGYKLLYILIFKVVIHLIGVGLFYKILRLLEYDKWYILIGAFIYSVSPVYQIYGRVFLVEPLTLFIITVFLYYLLKCQKNTRGFALLGLTGALVILSHPYYIFLPFTIYLMLVLSKQIQTKHFIISSVISLFIVALWPIRNAIVLKQIH